MNPAPIFLLYGNQALPIKETAQEIIAQQLGPNDPEMSLHRFDANDLIKESGLESASDLLENFTLANETLPFLSDRVVIRIDHVELLKAPKSKTGGSSMERFYRALVQTLQHPPDFCRYLLTAEVTKDSELSSPLLKALKGAKAVIRKFVAYEDDSPVGWVISRARSKQLELDNSAAQLLIDLMGNDLNDLDQELEKLSLYFIDTGRITEQGLLELVHANKHFSAFRITQSLSQKQLAPAIEPLGQILQEQSGSHIRLYGLILNHFRGLLKIHYLWQQKIPESQFATLLKMHPYRVKLSIQQARQFSLLELENLLITLADLDLLLKFNAKLAMNLYSHLFQAICQGDLRNSSLTLVPLAV